MARHHSLQTICNCNWKDSEQWRYFPKIRKGQQKHPPKGQLGTLCWTVSVWDKAIGLQWSSGMNSASLRRTYLRSSHSRTTRYLMSFILKGGLQEGGQPSLDGCTPYSYLLKHKMWEMRFCQGGKKKNSFSKWWQMSRTRHEGAERAASGRAAVRARLCPPHCSRSAAESAWKCHRLAFDRHLPSTGAG